MTVVLKKNEPQDLKVDKIIRVNEIYYSITKKASNNNIETNPVLKLDVSLQ